MAEPRKVAIVTGAGKRVGRVLAEGLLADGWTLVAHVHNDHDDVPAGAAFVADALGFLAPGEPVALAAAGRWRRLTTGRGHVVTRPRLL